MLTMFLAGSLGGPGGAAVQDLRLEPQRRRGAAQLSQLRNRVHPQAPICTGEVSTSKHQYCLYTRPHQIQNKASICFLPCYRGCGLQEIGQVQQSTVATERGGHAIRSFPRKKAIEIVLLSIFVQSASHSKERPQGLQSKGLTNPQAPPPSAADGHEGGERPPRVLAPARLRLP